MQQQYALWDIDSIIINGNWDAPDIQVRPYFKELFMLTRQKYKHRLYTAADNIHAFHVCATLCRDWGFPPAYAEELYRTALTCDNCPMIWKGEVYEKCLDKACELLGCSIDDIHVHIDDHPDISRWSRQDKRLWVPPYEGDTEDTHFYTLIERFKQTNSLI